jgi:tetratricopeptide (TPR) repeat protein
VSVPFGTGRRAIPQRNADRVLPLVNETVPTAPTTGGASPLDRLDTATLVQRAQAYIDSGHPNEAMTFIRAALRRAPLRRDLRRLLVVAIEAGADVGQADLKAGGLEDWQRQYAGTEGEPEGGRPLRHSFGRSRPHAASPKLVFATIAFVLAGVAAMIGGWSFLRERGPGLPAGAGPMAGADPAGADDPDHWLILEAQEYESAKRLDLAIEKVEQVGDASRRDPLLARLYAARGSELEKAGRHGPARAAYEKALERDGSDVTVLRALGSLLHDMGRRRQQDNRDAALDLYAQASNICCRRGTLAEQDTGILLLLARIEFARGDDAAAAENLRKIVAFAPDGADATRAREILAQRNLRL